jgi:type III restriction enzyme
MFLFEKLGALQEAGTYNESIPDCVFGNLNPLFELRPYQNKAFSNFINYFENDRLRSNPTQVLFHMATGSGKTLIMAGLIMYLFRKGYRNFLFFVHLDNIIQKTKDNFLNQASTKYLFAPEIIIDGEHIPIREVDNFQGVSSDAINICFTTIQKLHSDMFFAKENAPSFDDFSEQKTVLISDEAHHLNVDTRKGSVGLDDEDTKSWEYTVRRIFNANRDNVLLEFTATCDLKNKFIFSEYENKIIFDYDLRRFREEKYSKQVKAIRADISHEERMLQALLLSQYRLKVFQDNRLNAKPVVLFKSKTITESKQYAETFHEMVRTLNGNTVKKIITSSPIEEIKRIDGYFKSDYDKLAQELREEFSPIHCISVNDDKEATEWQLHLNSLEDINNPYRAIFEVKKLDEGWDVLNLFDIVRLYETRDAKNGKPGSATIAEAQLIGRGARYYPFIVDEDQEKYQRKYDNDIDNPLRICEELYYHCQYDSRYIDELNKALIASGIMPDNQTNIQYTLKESFKKDDFYKSALVFRNSRKEKSRKDIKELLPSVRSKEYTVMLHTGKTAIDTMMSTISNTKVNTHVYRTTIKQIASQNFSIIHRALRRIDIFKFHSLQSYFPNVSSLKEFIIDESYLGGVKMIIESNEETPAAQTLFDACFDVLSKIGNEISAIKTVYVGTYEFTDSKFYEVFQNKTLYITDPHGDGAGISQNAHTVSPDLKIDLSDKEWFVFNDNYGTSEEKAFVKYFSTFVNDLKKEYEKVYLVRNERQLVLYSFDGGEHFEPDYLLFLRKKHSSGYDQYQIFVEPKGDQLITKDKWKEDFLLQIEKRGIPKKTFVDDYTYHVWGFPFFNKTNRVNESTIAFERLTNNGKIKPSTEG